MLLSALLIDILALTFNFISFSESF